MSEIAEEIYNSGEITEALKNLPLDAAIIAKMSAEIEGILAKTTDNEGCEVYLLRTYQNGYFPVLGYGNTVLGMEFMHNNDVWKVGKTCNGENGRYPNDVYFSNEKNGLLLTKTQLKYEKIASGSSKEMLILEKILIYSYPFWSGHKSLLRPPGCKIYR